MVPIESWQNSSPVFGAAAFCATKIDDFDIDLFDNIVNEFIKEEVIEVAQLEETNSGGH